MSNFKKIAALALSVLTVLALASCVAKSPCTTHVDKDGDKICDVCGKEFGKKDPVCTEHNDADGDEKCDNCGADVPNVTPPECTEHVDANKDEKCDNCGATVEIPECSHTDGNGDKKCDKCGEQIIEHGSDQGNGGGNIDDYGDLNGNEWDN